MARSAEPIVLGEVEREELDPGSFNTATVGVARPDHPAGRGRDRQPGQRAPVGDHGSDGALLAAALERRARSGAGRPVGRCAASGDAADLHPGTDLRHPGPGLRTAGSQRYPDHALEPERAGPRSGEAGAGRDHLPRLGRSFFKRRLTSSPIACAPG
jgi:hypothetical protein